MMSLDKHTMTLRGAKSISHHRVTSESDNKGIGGGKERWRRIEKAARHCGMSLFHFVVVFQFREMTFNFHWHKFRCSILCCKGAQSCLRNLSNMIPGVCEALLMPLSPHSLCLFYLSSSPSPSLSVCPSLFFSKVFLFILLSVCSILCD